MSQPEITRRRLSFLGVNGMYAAVIVGALLIVHAGVIQPKLLHAARLRDEIATLKDELARGRQWESARSSIESRLESNLASCPPVDVRACPVKRPTATGDDELAVFQSLSTVAGNGLIEFGLADNGASADHSRARFRTVLDGTMAQTIRWLSELDASVGTVHIERMAIQPRGVATAAGPSDSPFSVEIWFRIEAPACRVKK